MITHQEGMTPCIEWLGARSGDGYGAVCINGKQLAAHRVAWSKVNGRIPERMWVLHRCDNPLCVNPEHLFLGTPKDNIQDCIKKGRRNTPFGEQHANSKLNVEAVKFIRASKGNLSASFLAHLFDVTESLVYQVQTKRIWKHVEV